MGRYIGVDWAGGCWVVVDYDGEPTVSTEPSILNVWHRFKSDAVTILVDIPIGFEPRGPRECDSEARQMVGSRASTVFSVPVESAIRCRDYQQARDNNIDGEFNGLGSQSWGLLPRIREVDVFLKERPEAKRRVHESHPEVCFAALAGRESTLPSKRSSDGGARRLELISGEEREFGEEITSFVRERMASSQWHHRIQNGRLDDVVDAAVLALTAKLAEERGYPTLPEGRAIQNPPVIVHPGEGV